MLVLHPSVCCQHGAVREEGGGGKASCCASASLCCCTDKSHPCKSYPAGDRDLADAVKTSDIVQASGKAHPSYLHVFVKLSDVETVSIRTLMRELSLANPAAAEEYLSSTLDKPSKKRWVSGK